MKTLLLALVLLAFGTYSTEVVVSHGYFGFLRLAGREPWGMQMLVDLSIFVALFTGFLVPDAKKRGISPWPYVVLCVTLGSIGALAYLVRRGFHDRRAAEATA